MPGAPDFRDAARRVVSRLFLRAWCVFLSRTAVPLFLGLSLLVAALRLAGCRLDYPAAAVALALGWAAVTVCWSWSRRPGPVAALALWDERAGRHEMFASAYCFEVGGEIHHQGTKTPRHQEEKSPPALRSSASSLRGGSAAAAEDGAPRRTSRNGRNELGPSCPGGASAPRREIGEELHLARSRLRLADDLARLPRDLPVSFPHRAWVSLGLFLALVFSGLLSPPVPAEDRPLSRSDRERARGVGRDLDESRKVLDSRSGLTQQEREAAKALSKSLEATAEKLRGISTSQTPRDVLAELERRAREAEALAEALGGGTSVGDGEKAGLLSAEMLAALARSADTAELAHALERQAAEPIAAEAEKTREKLAGGPSLEESQRFEKALAAAGAVATEQDKRSPVGRRLLEARDELSRRRLPEAAEQFAQLAKQFTDQAQRAQAARQLERLADALRRSGGKIFGRTADGMRQLAPREYEIPEALSMPPLSAGRLMPGQELSWLPGAAEGQPLGYLPVPGAGMEGEPFDGAGMGEAPIPGTGMGEGLAFGQGFGEAPVPGGEIIPDNAGTGGSKAGRGSAAYSDTPTTPTTATSTGVVRAAPGKTGPSAVRRVAGREHTESARTSSREVALQMLSTAEQALNEEPLPLSRREQVRRYFTALRKEIEK